MSRVEGQPDGRKRLADIEHDVSAQVRPRPWRSAAVDSEQSTASTSPAALAGPNLEIVVPEQRPLVAILVHAELKGDGSSRPTIALYEANDMPLAQPIIRTAQSTYAPRWCDPELSSLAGGSLSLSSRFGHLMLFRPVATGRLTYSCHYGTDGAGTAFFKNVRMWAKFFASADLT